MGQVPQDAKAIFLEALEYESDEARATYLDEACGEDRELRGKVEGLLAAHAKAGGFLETPPFASGMELDDVPWTGEPGTIIDRYELLEKIGEGGMGVVYLAEQTTPIRRKVALKVIKPGMDSRRVLAHFEAERQTLALLEHPNIARIYDAGSTKFGYPFFVMEYVHGVRITEYCNSHRLTIKQRIELFLQVCEAIHYAHQKGIIHRDIKPSNVVVSDQEDGAIPKVIDFGVAKAIGRPLTEHTLFAEPGQLIGTPEYMSPEQAELTNSDIDTRSDIYSLGVLLYELLSGTLPFDRGTFRAATFDEIVRIIREKDPPRPSTRLLEMGEKAAMIAVDRSTEVGVLSKCLRKELEWIPLKAMRKDPGQRYRSAHDLAADIHNYLDGRPLVAGPESMRYRLRKCALRHRTHAVVGAFVLVALAVTILAVVSHIASKQEKRSVEEALEKQKTLLARQTAEVYYGEGRYDQALKYIRECVAQGGDDPNVQVLHSRILWELGNVDEAVAVLEELVSNYSQEGAAYELLAVLYFELGNGDREAEYRKKAEKSPPETPEAFYLRAIAAEGLDEALQMLSAAIEIESDHYPSLKARAQVYHTLADYRNMERDAIVMKAQHPDDPTAHALYAIALREQGEYAEAIKEHDLAIACAHEDGRRLIDLYHQRYETLFRKGDFEAALADAQKCADMEPDNCGYRFWVIGTLVVLKRYEEARSEYKLLADRRPGVISHLNTWICRFAFDALDMGHDLELPEQWVTNPAFLRMREAIDLYSSLKPKARRFVASGITKTLSPDGKQMAYGRSEQYLADYVREGNIPGRDHIWHSRFPGYRHSEHG